MKRILIVILLPVFALNAMETEDQNNEQHKKARSLLTEINTHLDNNSEFETLRKIGLNLENVKINALRHEWLKCQPKIHAETTVETQKLLLKKVVKLKLDNSIRKVPLNDTIDMEQTLRQSQNGVNNAKINEEYIKNVACIYDLGSDLSSLFS